jgi:DNA-binding IclR family transcriptional regulator
MQQPAKTGRSIQSVQRAIDIINCFADSKTELTLSEISTALGLNKSTVHGILNTLYQNDFVRQNSSGRYMLGGYFARRFGTMDASIRNMLKETALEGMNYIANQYGASCCLFMLELGELLLVNRIRPQNEAYAITTYASYVQPLYCSASGKVLLADMSEGELDQYLQVNRLIPRTEKTITSQQMLRAELETVRSQGYGVEDEELGFGVYALSVPVYNASRHLFATISAAGMAFRLNPQRNAIISDLKALSFDLTQRLFR